MEVCVQPLYVCKHMIYSRTIAFASIHITFVSQIVRFIIEI